MSCKVVVRAIGCALGARAWFPAMSSIGVESAGNANRGKGVPNTQQTSSFGTAALNRVHSNAVVVRLSENGV